MRALAAYRNLADSAVLSAEQGTVTGFPLDNLKLRSSGKFTRMNVGGGTNRYLWMDFVTPVALRFLGLFGLNATGMVIGMVSPVQGSANGLAWINVAPIAATVPDAGVPGLPNDVKLVLPGTQAYRYWRINPNWGRPVGEDYFQIARLWASEARGVVEIPDGIDGRPQFKVAGMSIGDTSAGGQFYEDKRPTPRQASVSITTEDKMLLYGITNWSATSALAAASLQDLQMHAGSTGEIVWSPGQTPLALHRLGFRGRLQSGVSISPLGEGLVHSASFEVIEEM